MSSGAVSGKLFDAPGGAAASALMEEIRAILFGQQPNSSGSNKHLEEFRIAFKEMTSSIATDFDLSRLTSLPFVQELERDITVLKELIVYYDNETRAVQLASGVQFNFWMRKLSNEIKGKMHSIQSQLGGVSHEDQVKILPEEAKELWNVCCSIQHQMLVMAMEKDSEKAPSDNVVPSTDPPPLGKVLTCYFLKGFQQFISTAKRVENIKLNFDWGFNPSKASHYLLLKHFLGPSGTGSLLESTERTRTNSKRVLDVDHRLGDETKGGKGLHVLHREYNQDCVTLFELNAFAKEGVIAGFIEMLRLFGREVHNSQLSIWRQCCALAQNTLESVEMQREMFFQQFRHDLSSASNAIESNPDPEVRKMHMSQMAQKEAPKGAFHNAWTTLLDYTLAMANSLTELGKLDCHVHTLEFRTLFSLDGGEKLLSDHFCVLVRGNVWVPGVLYVTSTRMCFSDSLHPAKNNETSLALGRIEMEFRNVLGITHSVLTPTVFSNVTIIMKDGNSFPFYCVMQMSELLSLAQKQLESCHSTKRELQKGPVREGLLVKQGKQVKNWKTRHFELFEDSFLYKKKKEAKTALGRIFCKQILAIEPESNQPIGKNASASKTSTGSVRFSVLTWNRRYRIVDKDEISAQKWMDAIRVQLRDFEFAHVFFGVFHFPSEGAFEWKLLQLDFVRRQLLLLKEGEVLDSIDFALLQSISLLNAATGTQQFLLSVLGQKKPMELHLPTQFGAFVFREMIGKIINRTHITLLEALNIKRGIRVNWANASVSEIPPPPTTAKLSRWILLQHSQILVFENKDESHPLYVLQVQEIAFTRVDDQLRCNFSVETPFGKTTATKIFQFASSEESDSWLQLLMLCKDVEDDENGDIQLPGAQDAENQNTKSKKRASSLLHSKNASLSVSGETVVPPTMTIIGNNVRRKSITDEASIRNLLVQQSKSRRCPSSGSADKTPDSAAGVTPPTNGTSPLATSSSGQGEGSPTNPPDEKTGASNQTPQQQTPPDSSGTDPDKKQAEFGGGGGGDDDDDDDEPDDVEPSL